MYAASMVRPVLSIMYTKVRVLLQASCVLAVFTFGSQLLALEGDRPLALEFGAGALLDVYYAAFRIPDLLYVLFASTPRCSCLFPLLPQPPLHRRAGCKTPCLPSIFTFLCRIPRHGLR
jgi:Uncharacterized membrane protein, putative virulence factor